MGTSPQFTIVMPVFDTGRLLLESVRSVVDQTFFSQRGGAFWELLIIDDGSTDAETLDALGVACEMSGSVRVLMNVRAKGVAGARNTGVFAARGHWIGFLDSDDLWYPEFLAQQHAAFAAFPEAHWGAAHFDVGDSAAQVQRVPLEKRSPCLHAAIATEYRAQRVSRLCRPVEVLLRCGCMQIMTVRIRRDLLQSLGGFNEQLQSAEDYDLWLRLAVVEDLYLAPIDAGIYRQRDGSLTKSDRPMYYCEDKMLLQARRDKAFAAFDHCIGDRLHKVYDSFCYHFRAKGNSREARRFAVKLIREFPLRSAGWKHLLASGLGR